MGYTHCVLRFDDPGVLELEVKDMLARFWKEGEKRFVQSPGVLGLPVMGARRPCIFMHVEDASFLHMQLFQALPTPDAHGDVGFVYQHHRVHGCNCGEPGTAAVCYHDHDGPCGVA